MKKLYILLLIVPVLVFAQEQNYIKNTTYKKPSTEEQIDVDNPADAAVTVQYFDGLGRPIQQVAHKQSNTGKDIIVHTGYDEFGRQTKEYLPYVRSSASVNFDPNGEANTMSFYATNNVSLSGNPFLETTGNPYSEKVLEASPLFRVFEQAAQGDPWEKTYGKTIKFDYQTNEDDEVIYFKALTQWSAAEGLYTIALVKDGHYSENQLYKTITKDENWSSASGLNNTTEEFKNKQGQVVLKRTYNNNDSHDTYYVYDIYGNLTYVIPPLVDTSSTIDETVLNGLCYQYKYDSRNRLVAKKIPGKIWEFILYDKLDRVVGVGPTAPPFTNLIKHGWSITKYDKFNRPILTGWMSSNPTITNQIRKNLQSDIDAQTVFSESRTENTPDVTIMGITYRYSNTAWPTSGYHVLSVNYYDNYNYPDPPTIPAEVEEQEVYYNNTQKPIGLITGTWTRVLRTSTSYRREMSYTLYDKKSRPIRVFNRNGETAPGGFTQIDSKFDFSGKVERSTTIHRRTNADPTIITTKDFYTYSDQDKLVKHIQQINNGTPQLIAHNSYDELGNLTVKRVGGTDVSAAIPLQKIDYKYNIRGWLLSINDGANLEQMTDPIDLFAFKINYNTVKNDVNGSIKPLFNGNIAETFWKTANDNHLRSYSYKYDDLNRLNESLFHKNDVLVHAYNEKITEYDKNGNIKGLQRNSSLEDELDTIEIDDLTYEYRENTNELIKLTDDSTPTNNGGFVDGADLAIEYEYDDFGNMTKDHNKGITEIVYNHLNLPIKITFANSGQIEYVYNALGVKTEKIVTQGSTVTTTKYMAGGYQYENNVLTFFPHAEGYVTKEGSSTYRHVFNYTDHLGNIRLKYCDLNLNGTIESNEILEENHYYPFGMKHERYNEDSSVLANKYKYNGKEWQDELGLNVTAMDFRQYDNAIGRFLGMDRLAEMSQNLTPYRFGFNNPVFWSDPSGLFENNGDLEHCPTCPNTPAFQPLIDDPNNEYFYDPETNSASQVIQLDEVVVSANENSDLGNAMSTAMWTVNTGVGFASLGVGYQGQFHRMNEVYHITKTAGTSYFWQDRWKKPLAKQWRVDQISKVQNSRNLATKLTKVGGVLLVGDIALSGEIKPSHVINGLMLGASMTGVGSIVAGVWFIADFGTMGVNYLINGEAKGIGDMIDESDWGKSKTVKMYDGLY